MNKQVTEVPEGYMLDGHGRLVPEDLVDEVDIVRDDLVRNLVVEANALRTDLRRFKQNALAEVKSFIEVANNKYEVKVGGRKGNVTLLSYDGTRKVQVQVSEYMRFDERIQGAKKLIDECIHEWTEGSRSEVKALVDHAFKTDKEGEISMTRILSLTRLNIRDEKWLRAMEAIRDSMQVVDSSEYIRIYERADNHASWEPVSLDIAKL